MRPERVRLKDPEVRRDIRQVQDRGILREGMAADITIFDSDTIHDTGTCAEPNQ